MQAGKSIIVAVIIIKGVGAVIIFTGQRARIAGRTRIKRRAGMTGMNRHTGIRRRTRRANRFGAGIHTQKIIVAVSGGDTAGNIEGIALVGL